MGEQKPSTGRIVHYVSYGTPGGEYTSQCRAAIVSEVDPHDDSHIGLVVFNPLGMFFRALADGGCLYEHEDNGPDGRPRGGTWHWPRLCQPAE